MRGTEFLPVSREEMLQRDWYYYDFLLVTPDAYIDHPSFGTTLIARMLEGEGYRVAILAQPDWHDAEAFRAMGRPRYGVLIGGGNLDSMVAHYTLAKAGQRSVLPRRENGVSAGSAHHRLCQPGQRGLSRYPHRHRGIGGVPAALCPL